jgi:hypothetical protein
MDSPQNHIWGPHLWTILHSSTERIGLPQYKRLPTEEYRIWKNLLGSLRYSLPCPLCKKHYTAYFSTYIIPNANKDIIRSWLYNLHTQINTQTNKPTDISIENLPEIYSKPINFNVHLNIVIEQMNRALRLGVSSRIDVQNTIRHLHELKRFYDYF